MDGEFSIKEVVMPELFLALNFLQPPPSSTRPHVLGYTVSHNASGIVEMYGTNDTKFVLESTSSCPFVFIVAAINVLGAGEESDIISELICGASVFVQIAINLTRSK